MTRPPPRATTHWHIYPPGKTTFLKFMLKQLLSARQVVLLCDNNDVWLFFRGKVYFRPVDSGFRYLPRREAYCPIWALIDVDLKDGGAPFQRSSNIWPIQTSSPRPARWKSWRKQYQAALWGMPLWEIEDLMQGYAFRSSTLTSFDRASPLTILLPCSFHLLPEYNRFLSSLKKSLPLLCGPTPPTTGNKNLDAVLEVLHRERERRKAMADRGSTDDVRAPAVDRDENMVDGTSQQQVSAHDVEEALRILVCNATEEFGFAPRDVYSGILALPAMRTVHATAVKVLDYSQMRNLVRVFTSEQNSKGPRIA